MKPFILLLAVLMLTIPSCSKDDNKIELVRWRIERDLELRANGNTFTRQFTDLRDIANMAIGQLSAAGFNEEDLSNIEVLEAKLISLDGSRLNFMDNLEFHVFDLNNPGPDIEIAHRDPVDRSTNTVIDLFGSIPSPQMTQFLLLDFIGLRIKYGVVDPNASIRASLELTLRAVK